MNFTLLPFQEVTSAKATEAIRLTKTHAGSTTTAIARRTAGLKKASARTHADAPF